MALVVVGCSASHTVTGSITLTDPAGVSVSVNTCEGTGGYSDLQEGATVTLRNESGTILASSALEAGRTSGSTCVFNFTLSGVPDDAKFYAVTVSHRGEISNSHAEMEANGWTFALTIGS